MRCIECMHELEEGKTFCDKCKIDNKDIVIDPIYMKPNTIIKDRYVIGKVLGHGGFGITYLAYDKDLDKNVAIKEYMPRECSTRTYNELDLTIYDGEKSEQFTKGKNDVLLESRKLAKCRDIKSVVHVIEEFEANNTVYIVMEYLKGETLLSKLKKENAKGNNLSVSYSLTIILTILEALINVHSKNIYHRDISPDNIFLADNGDVKLIDFGAARSATMSHSVSLTIFAKNGYTPPEQYRSKSKQGSYTDVYALAAVFYRMITGETPPNSLDRLENDEIKLPHKMGVEISKNIETALMNALNVRCEDRTQTAKEFKEELESNIVKKKVVKHQKVDIGKISNKVIIIMLSLISIVAILSILLFTGIIKFNPKIIGSYKIKDTQTRVPNFVNEDIDKSLKKGEEYKLKIQIKDKEYSDVIPENKVLRQDKKAGLLVNINSVVDLVVSAGIKSTYVPNIVGMIKDKAIEKLKEQELKVDIKKEKGKIAPGSILSQSIEADTKVDTGTIINLVISTGIDGGDSTKEEIVDDLYNMNFDEAVDTEIAKYLYIETEETKYSDDIKKGNIISQDIKAGSKLNQNQVIKVVVSLGRELIIVPDILYKTQTEAVKTLQSSGLVVEIVEEASQTVAKGSVIRQSINANDRVPKNSNIIIYVSSGVINNTKNQNSTQSEEQNSEVIINNNQVQEEVKKVDETFSINKTRENKEIQNKEIQNIDNDNINQGQYEKDLNKAFELID